jgi:hypothetical protein
MRPPEIICLAFTSAIPAQIGPHIVLTARAYRKEVLLQYVLVPCLLCLQKSAVSAPTDPNRVSVWGDTVRASWRAPQGAEPMMPPP